MAKVITNPKTYAGKENAEQVLRPLFIGALPQAMGFRVILDVKSKITLNFIGYLLKICGALGLILGFPLIITLVVVGSVKTSDRLGDAIVKDNKK